MPSLLYVSNPLIPTDTICPFVIEKRRAFAICSCLSSVDIVARTGWSTAKSPSHLNTRSTKVHSSPCFNNHFSIAIICRSCDMTSIYLAFSPISRVASENLHSNTVRSRDRSSFPQLPPSHILPYLHFHTSHIPACALFPPCLLFNIINRQIHTHPPRRQPDSFLITHISTRIVSFHQRNIGPLRF
jgi:hypothetical protein